MRRFVLVTLGIAALFVLFSVAMVVVMKPRPKEYFLADPSDKEERARLLATIGKTLDELQTFERGPSYVSSAVNDADRGYPYDMAKLAFAIERFTLETGALPPSVGDLYTAGILAPASTEFSYSLELQNGEWRIYSLYGHLMAMGN